MPSRRGPYLNLDRSFHGARGRPGYASSVGPLPPPRMFGACRVRALRSLRGPLPHPRRAGCVLGRGREISPRKCAGPRTPGASEVGEEELSGGELFRRRSPGSLGLRSRYSLGRYTPPGCGGSGHLNEPSAGNGLVVGQFEIAYGSPIASTKPASLWRGPASPALVRHAASYGAHVPSDLHMNGGQPTGGLKIWAEVPGHEHRSPPSGIGSEQ